MDIQLLLRDLCHVLETATRGRSGGFGDRIQTQGRRFAKARMWEWFSFFFSSKDFVYLFLESREGREKEKERNIDVREKL